VPCLCLCGSFTGNPFANGGIFYTWNITSYSETPANVKPQLIPGSDTGLKWPNSVAAAPSGMFGEGTGQVLVVADGFLVPGKDDGGIYAFVWKNEAWTGPIQLSTTIKVW
jgi:hypothetical protein